MCAIQSLQQEGQCLVVFGDFCVQYRVFNRRDNSWCFLETFVCNTESSTGGTMLGGFWRLLCAIQRPNGDTGVLFWKYVALPLCLLKGQRGKVCKAYDSCLMGNEVNTQSKPI